jgi:hypothetical protein
MRGTAAALLILVATASGAEARQIGGYVTAGSGSIDYLVYRKAIPQASVGVFWQLPGDRVRVGVEADILTSNGYVSGRGGPFAEVTLIRQSRVQPFVRGGYFHGEDSSWVAGGGVDLRVSERGALRLCVQDAFRRSSVTPRGNAPVPTFHEPSVQIGWVWNR